jgi:hypothetical protein
MELLEVFDRRLHKIRSWAAIMALGYPTISGVVVTEWDAVAFSILREFAKDLDTDRLLIRSDAPLETGRYPRGGYEVKIDNIEIEARKFLDQRRTPYFLEPRSRHRDMYSLGVLLWPDSDTVVEIVGPGFDASDLNRGDLNPHERFKFSSEGTEMLEHWTTSDAQYRESVRLRLRKIADLAVPLLEQRTEDRIVESGKLFLRENHEDLLLNAESYRPVPLELILVAVENVVEMGHRLPGVGMPGPPLVVSLSYWGSDLLPIYWDIVWPDLKYEGAESSGVRQ